MDLLYSIPVGVALAAACGLRVFLPLLVLSLAARAGIVDPGPGLAWVGSSGALAALAVMALTEIAAYYVPWVDNALDVIATPLATAAGAFAAACTMLPHDQGVHFSSSLAAMLSGAGVAGVTQLSTVSLRAASTATTGGLANWIVATLENVGAGLLAVITLLAPVLGVLLLVLGAYLGWRWFGPRVKSVTKPMTRSQAA